MMWPICYFNSDNSRFITLQNASITSIHTEVTLTSLKEFEVSLLLIDSEEMI